MSLLVGDAEGLPLVHDSARLEQIRALAFEPEAILPLSEIAPDVQEPVGRRRADPVRIGDSRQSLLGERNHVRVKVNAGDLTRAKPYQDFDAYTASASNLQHALPLKRPARTNQGGGFQRLLAPGPHGVVHHGKFQLVELHNSPTWG